MAKYGAIQAQITGLSKDYMTGDDIMTLTIPKGTISDARNIAREANGKPLSVEFTDKKARRSLNANNFAWELIARIAEKTGVDKEEVYRNAIMHGNEFTRLSIAPEAVESFERVWSSKGIGWQCHAVDDEPDNRRIIFAYYGSSVYDTGAMAALIDRLIQDANALGIPTISDAELASLLSSWKPS